jgi:hypothetical protein
MSQFVLHNTSSRAATVIGQCDLNHDCSEMLSQTLGHAATELNACCYSAHIPVFPSAT